MKFTLTKIISLSYKLYISWESNIILIIYNTKKKLKLKDKRKFYYSFIISYNFKFKFIFHKNSHNIK